MSPPPGHEPFLRAICQAPDDDAPRLVFADWLDENGDPERAEFIRAECTACRALDVEVRDQAAARAVALYREHHSTWFGELPSADGVRWDTGTVRGFYSAITVSDAGQTMAAAQKIFEASPIDVVSASHDLHDPDSIRRLEALLTSAYARRLRRLVLSRRRSGSAVAALLVRSVGLTALKQLWIRQTGLGDVGLAAVSGSPHFAGLAELDVAYNALTDRSAIELANSPFLRDLRILSIRGNEFTQTGWTVLRSRFGESAIIK